MGNIQTGEMLRFYSNMYEGPEIHHFDLYRLSGTAGTGRLSLSSSFSEAVSLIEWADRLGSDGPTEFIDISFLVLPKVLLWLIGCISFSQREQQILCKVYSSLYCL